jgi:hypothetical protein
VKGEDVFLGDGALLSGCSNGERGNGTENGEGRESAHETSRVESGWIKQIYLTQTYQGDFYLRWTTESMTHFSGFADEKLCPKITTAQDAVS